jgi:hypothetical protein
MFRRTLLVCLAIIQLSAGFYLPGLAPVTYCDNENDVKCQVILNFLIKCHSNGSLLYIGYPCFIPVSSLTLLYVCMCVVPS